MGWLFTERIYWTLCFIDLKNKMLPTKTHALEIELSVFIQDCLHCSAQFYPHLGDLSKARITVLLSVDYVVLNFTNDAKAHTLVDSPTTKIRL